MPGVRLRGETKRRDAPGESPLDVFLDEGSIPSGSTIILKGINGDNDEEKEIVFIGSLSPMLMNQHGGAKGIQEITGLTNL